MSPLKSLKLFALAIFAVIPLALSACSATATLSFTCTETISIIGYTPSETKVTFQEAKFVLPAWASADGVRVYVNVTKEEQDATAKYQGDAEDYVAKINAAFEQLIAHSPMQVQSAATGDSLEYGFAGNTQLSFFVGNATIIDMANGKSACQLYKWLAISIIAPHKSGFLIGLDYLGETDEYNVSFAPDSCASAQDYCSRLSYNISAAPFVQVMLDIGQGKTPDTKFENVITSNVINAAMAKTQLTNIASNTLVGAFNLIQYDLASRTYMLNRLTDALPLIAYSKNNKEPAIVLLSGATTEGTIAYGQYVSTSHFVFRGNLVIFAGGGSSNTTGTNSSGPVEVISGDVYVIPAGQ